MTPPETVTVDRFERDIRKVMGLVIAHQDEEARELFNREVYHRYIGVMVGDAKHPLKAFTIYFVYLDKYFNNEGAKILGWVDRETTLESYYGEFPVDLAEARRREREEKAPE